MKSEKRFIPILSDYGFKTVFADEVDTLFLRKALQAVIQSEFEIKEVEFLNKEFIGTTPETRAGVYDLLCRDERGNTFIVEMQLGPYPNFIHRAKFYVLNYLDTLVKKGKYFFDDLTPIYCIGFLAKNIFPHSEQYYHFGTLKNQEGEVMDDQIVHIIVEISKFDKASHEIETDLDKLIYLMKNLESLYPENKSVEFLDEEWLTKAIEKLETTAMTAEQRMHYSRMLAVNASAIYQKREESKQMRIEIEADVHKKAEARVRRAEIIAKRKAEAKAKREAEAKAQKAEAKAREAAAKAREAEAKAREEAETKAHEKALEMAKHFLALKVKVNKVAEMTGLSVEEVNSLVETKD